MITKMRTKGSNCTHILSPPNGLLAWAKAGVTNISLSFVLSAFGRRAARRRCRSRPAKSARTIAVSAPIATLGLPSEFDRFGHSAWRTCRVASAPLRVRRARFHPMVNRVQKPPPSSRQRTAAQRTPSQDVFERIAGALERLAPRAPETPRFAAADAFSWHPDERRLAPVANVNRVEMSLLKGIDRLRDMLLENTQRFARALPANNALLWGARGMGKSSLVKAVHAAINAGARKSSRGALKLIEIHREEIESLPDLMTLLRGSPYRFIVFCDDLSFEGEDTSYKSLKAVPEGGIEGRPNNVILYATSNRRHLMARDMIENERSTAINPGEAVEEKVSLSDRFGLWLGFHRCRQDDNLAMHKGYCGHFGIKFVE